MCRKQKTLHYGHNGDREPYYGNECRQTDESFLLTEGVCSTAVGWVRLTHGAALSLRDHHLLTVTQLITLDLITQDLTAVTHADPAWFRLPDVPVGVHLAVRCAAHIIACSRQRWEDTFISLIQSCDFFVVLFSFFCWMQLFCVRIAAEEHSGRFKYPRFSSVELLHSSCLSCFLTLPNAANMPSWTRMQ